jgi:hypothetical protein
LIRRLTSETVMGISPGLVGGRSSGLVGGGAVPPGVVRVWAAVTVQTARGGDGQHEMA